MGPRRNVLLVLILLLLITEHFVKESEGFAGGIRRARTSTRRRNSNRKTKYRKEKRSIQRSEIFVHVNHA